MSAEVQTITKSLWCVIRDQSLYDLYDLYDSSGTGDGGKAER